jgi:hypothetical protein
MQNFHFVKHVVCFTKQYITALLCKMVEPGNKVKQKSGKSPSNEGASVKEQLTKQL